MDAAFTRFGYDPHTEQRKIHAAEKDFRFITADCGRRFGKSHLGGRRLAVKSLEAAFVKGLSRTGKRHEYWVVGPEYTDAEKEFRVLYDTLSKLGAQFDRPGTYYSPDSSSNILSMYNGGFLVQTKSAKHPETLVGEGLHGLIMAEAAKIKSIVWPKFLRPMLSDYKGWAEFTSTPEGKNWFYEMWVKGQDPNLTEYWSIKAPSWTNDKLFPGGRQDPEILSLEAGMSVEKFKQEIGADFTEFVGRVYKDFDEEVNVVDTLYNPKLPLFICADYGYTNPNVLLFVQVGVWGDVYVIAEYYQRQRTIEQVVEEVRAHPRLSALARVATRLYGDPEDPAATATLAEKLQLDPQGNTGGLLSTRIELIRKLLRAQPLELEDGHPEKLPKLWFDRSCKNTIREFNDYRYPETKDEASTVELKENPLKADDHAPEALSRFAGGYFHAEKPKKRARNAEAVFG